MCGSLILQDFGILCSSFLTKRWLTVCEPPQHIFQNQAFARHFAIAGIMRMLDEEAMEESLEEEMEEEPEAEYDDHHCKG